MSLISEALKKARQEAARQDALRQGTPYAVGAAEPPARRSLWLMLLAGLGAGCLLAAALFAVAFFSGWGPFARPQAATPPQVAEAAPAPAPQAAPPPVIQEQEAPSVQPEEALPVPSMAPPAALPPVPRTAEPVPSAPEPAPAPAPSIEVRPAAPAPAPEPEPAPPAAEERPVTPAAPAPAPAAPAPSSGLVEGQVYTGEVPVPGGGSVKLNGIAFSESRPVVVLDGRVMGTGEVIQGFTVVAIESGRVKLQGHGATVYVAPK